MNYNLLLIRVSKNENDLRMKPDDWMKIDSISGSKYPECKAMYKTTNQLIEKWSYRCIFLAGNVFGPLLVSVIAGHCYFLYFTTDFGPAAFQLPIPMW